jgi:hypothetical protein
MNPPRERAGIGGLLATLAGGAAAPGRAAAVGAAAGPVRVGWTGEADIVRGL